MMIKVDYLDLHTDKSQEWAKGYIALTNLAWFSSFFRYEYSNWAIFRMLDIEEFSVIKWLNFGDRNPFLGKVTLDEDIGFVVKSDGSTTVTNEAWVILTKDESRKQGYQIFNCFPCFPNDRDYRFTHIQRFFTINVCQLVVSIQKAELLFPLRCCREQRSLRPNTNDSIF